MTSREKILKNIKSALKSQSRLADEPPHLDTVIRKKIAEITPNSLSGLVEQFKRELETVSGEFIVAGSEFIAVQHIEKILAENNETQISFAGSGLARQLAAELRTNVTVIDPQNLKERKITTLAEIATSIVDVEFAIAESGTLVIPFNTTSSTLPHFMPERVIALVRKDQLIATQFDLFHKIDGESAKNMLMVTGPSRTADIEKILILGAHGPRRLIVILIDEQKVLDTD